MMATKVRVETWDNHTKELTESEAALHDLIPISCKPISDIVRENPSLLIFPHDIENEDDWIGSSYIYSIHDCQLETGNIAGFIGFPNVELTIHSRFSKSSQKDYFLHYLLQKVFLGNIFDFNVSSDEEQIFDFLIYFFPLYLKSALAQGIYRKYTRYEFNDADVCGAINIQRHISRNYPFSGRIAYSTRLLATDNPVTQLIRHTIEYLTTTVPGRVILNYDQETRDSVMTIVSCTSSYSKSARRQVISQNMRPASHPYYTEYVPLQRLCLAILNHEDLSTGEDDDDVKGILFDCAWLWEEYLAILLTPFMVHPRNRAQKDGLKVFSSGNGLLWYPDFYSNDKTHGKYVIDAKYKHLEGNPSREDLQQVISYIYLLAADRGGFAFPEEKSSPGSTTHFIGKLNGYGNPLFSYGFHVPTDTKAFESFQAFADFMKQSEKSFVESISCKSDL